MRKTTGWLLMQSSASTSAKAAWSLPKAQVWMEAIGDDAHRIARAAQFDGIVNEALDAVNFVE